MPLMVVDEVTGSSELEVSCGAILTGNLVVVGMVLP